MPNLGGKHADLLKKPSTRRERLHMPPLLIANNLSQATDRPTSPTDGRFIRLPLVLKILFKRGLGQGALSPSERPPSRSEGGCRRLRESNIRAF